MVHSGRVLSRDATLAQSQLCDGDLLTLVVKPASSFALFGVVLGTVELWDIDDCKLIRLFCGHFFGEVESEETRANAWNGWPISINAAVFSENGFLGLSGSDDGTARLWNTENGDFM